MKHISLIESSLTAWFRLASAVLPSGYAPPPFFYFLLLTYDCDAACPFCFVPKEERGKKPFMPIEMVRDILRQIPGWSAVSFSGGEPMLHPEIFPILERASAHNRLSLVTNGLRLDDSAVRRLVAMAPHRFGSPGLTVIGVSLFESLRNGEQSAPVERKKRLLASIRDAKRAAGGRFPLVDLKMVIRDENVEHLDLPRQWVAEGLADVVTYQVESNILYPPYSDGRIGPMPQSEAWAAARSDSPPRIADTEALRRRIRDLHRSREAKEGRIRFYPKLSEDEIVRYYSGQALESSYSCVFPWSSLMITPLGNACLCRNPKCESLATSSIRQIWNGENFRSFRVAASRQDLASACAGCCFLIGR